MDEIRNRMKLTMQKLAEYKETKLWERLYFKCFGCEEIKSVAEAMLVEKCPTIDFKNENSGDVKVMVKEEFALLCNKCVNALGISPKCFGRWSEYPREWCNQCKDEDECMKKEGEKESEC